MDISFELFKYTLNIEAYCPFTFQMTALSYKKLDFEEFCAAAISTYQLEALEEWEQIAAVAFQHFEQEGNRHVSVEELARVGIFILP